MVNINVKNHTTIQSIFILIVVSFIALTFAPRSVLADNDFFPRKIIRVDCDRGETITKALKKARTDSTIEVKGTCRESVTITTDGLTLKGKDTAIIDGDGKDVVTIFGVQRITLMGFEIRNGSTGILAKGGASFALINTTVKNNFVTGIRVETNSSLNATDCIVEGNGFGIDVDLGSVIAFSSNVVIQNNNVFGIILGNNSSATFTKAAVIASNNGLGIQIGINSSAIISDAETSINASHNRLGPGLTVVSASHLFVFGGEIVASNNKTNGISIFSNSGVDLDNGARMISQNNEQNGLLLEKSALNMFNMPTFTGSSVTTSNNGENGLSAITESVVDMSGDSVLTSLNNNGAGLFVDNGSAVKIINATIENNDNNNDIDLKFGSLADISNSSFNFIKCDDTVQLRGGTGVTCPTP